MRGCRLSEERRERDRAKTICAAKQHFAASQRAGDEAVAVHSVHENKFLYVDQNVTEIVPWLYRVGILFLLFPEELQSGGELVRLRRAREGGDVEIVNSLFRRQMRFDKNVLGLKLRLLKHKWIVEHRQRLCRHV